MQLKETKNVWIEKGGCEVKILSTFWDFRLWIIKSSPYFQSHSYLQLLPSLINNHQINERNFDQVQFLDLGPMSFGSWFWKKPLVGWFFLGLRISSVVPLTVFLGFIKLSISKRPPKKWNLMQFVAFINMLKGLDQHQYWLNMLWQTEMSCITKCCKYISNMWMWYIIDNK